MTGAVEDYLRALRLSLRTPPEETSRILAEAEDHLRDSVAAGLAAGLTQADAADAAISSFGSVRAVVRAHETRRDQAAAIVADIAMPVLRLAGTLLLASFGVLVIGLVVIAIRGPDASTAPGAAVAAPSPALDWWPATGPVGLVLLGGYYLARRYLRRRGNRPRRMLLGGYAPLASTAGLAVAALTLTLLNSNGVTFPGQAPLAFGALGLAVFNTTRLLASRPPSAGATASPHGPGRHTGGD